MPPSSRPSQCCELGGAYTGPTCCVRAVGLEPRREDRDQREEDQDREADHRDALAEQHLAHDPGPPGRLRGDGRIDERDLLAHVVTRGSSLK